MKQFLPILIAVGCVASAYTHALAWCLTGKQAHAKKAMEILNALSATLESVSGHDTKLLIRMLGVRRAQGNWGREICFLMIHSLARIPLPLSDVPPQIVSDFGGR